MKARTIKKHQAIAARLEEKASRTKSPKAIRTEIIAALPASRAMRPIHPDTKACKGRLTRAQRLANGTWKRVRWVNGMWVNNVSALHRAQFTALTGETL